MERALSEIVTRGWVGLNAEWITDRPPKASNDGGSYADQILSKQKRTKP